ncbi:OsmC family protein [Pontibacter locisalis]|uniref:OsmC family protein n=1 Tax=Pontibacter locisalis TaxID=1719035 RepID=A0ABW5IRZ6_9BACT
MLVHLNHDKIHELDSEKHYQKALLDHIWREIELQGKLTEEQRSRLLEIAEKCPVHKTLSNTIRIISSLLPQTEYEQQ